VIPVTFDSKSRRSIPTQTAMMALRPMPSHMWRLRIRGLRRRSALRVDLIVKDERERPTGQGLPLCRPPLLAGPKERGASQDAN
jgi:hypothetical protein